MTPIKEIHCGDNLKIMQKMPDESVDLIYLDPPFFSGRNYEVIWKDGTEERSFKDTEWYRVECPKCRRDIVKAEKFCPKCGTDLKDAKVTRKNDIYVYIDWMIPRLTEMHRILKPTGSIYLHVDWHAVHYLKVEMDKIFGIKNFQNEIIWSYGARATIRNSGFPQKHDNILVYNKTNIKTYNVIYKPYKDQNFKRYNKEDENGRYALIKRKRSNGENYYGKSYVKEGVPETDVWDIPTMSSTSKERLGYPTQKPEALLERIIKASSNEGDIVFDPFCGCGTSLAVAKKLRRSYIGIDITPTSCQIIKDRINHQDSIIGLFPQSIEEYQKMEPHEFQNLVCRIFDAKNTSPNPNQHSGADGIVKSNLMTNEFGGSLIQVKRSKSVGVNVIKNLEATLMHSNTKIGFVVALSFGSGAKEQVKRAANIGLKIFLVECMELETFKFSNYKL